MRYIWAQLGDQKRDQGPAS